MNNYPIIALTGSFGSGSTRVAEILSTKHGYSHEKVSDLLKNKLKQEGTKIENIPQNMQRKILQDMGNKLREKFGPGYLVKQLMERTRAKGINGRIVFESIKNPGEVTELRKYPNTYLIAVNAPSDKRWERVKVKYYNNDLNQFEKDDERDRDEGGPYGQSVTKCVDLADIYVKNYEDRQTNPDWKEFDDKIYRFIKLVEQNGSRNPTIRELLMNNAYHTSLTSHCLKRQVGAIIAVPGTQTDRPVVQRLSGEDSAKEYVVATGANVVPEGQLCCQVLYKGCYRDKTRKEFSEKMKYCPECSQELEPVSNSCPACRTDFIKKYFGKVLGLCRALHAEESAILQTCLLGGVSLAAATLFTTTFPCLLCAKKIIAVGIKRVVWVEPYPDPDAKKMLEKAGVELIEFEGVKARAFYELFSVVT